LLSLLLIDKELSEVKVKWLASLDINSGFVSLDGVMNLIALTFDIENERPSLSLDVTAQVIVVLQFKLGSECNLNWQLGVSWNHTLHWSHFK